MKHTLSILFILIASYFNRSSAQSDSLHISNLHSVIKTPQPQLPLATNSVSSGSQTFTLIIYFTIDKPDSTSRLFISIGNAKDNGIIKTENISVVNNSNIIYMHNSTTNSDICRFYDKTTKYEIVITKQDLDQLKYVTLYGKHKNNNYSQKTYYQIK